MTKVGKLIATAGTAAFIAACGLTGEVEGTYGDKGENKSSSAKTEISSSSAVSSSVGISSSIGILSSGAQSSSSRENNGNSSSGNTPSSTSGVSSSSSLNASSSSIPPSSTSAGNSSSSGRKLIKICDAVATGHLVVDENGVSTELPTEIFTKNGMAAERGDSIFFQIQGINRTYGFLQAGAIPTPACDPRITQEMGIVTSTDYGTVTVKNYQCEVCQ